jgi:NlpC/P60 family putative phage cell wall peptidase
MNNENELAGRIVRIAASWIGTPYRHQASVKTRGTDCLGLIRGIWRELYGAEPLSFLPYSRDYGEFAASEPIARLACRYLEPLDPQEARPGDVMLFRWPRQAVAKHLGILSASNRVIHAWERAGVVEVNLHQGWRARIIGYFRFPKTSGAPR